MPDDVPWTPEVVRSSYRKFWLKHHPDKGGEPRDDIVDLFKELMALDEARASAVSTPVRERASPSPSEEWETCMGGCGALLKAGGWGVCNGCYKSGHKGRTEQCSDGFVLCRGCGVHVKASVGACKPCLKKERQADGNPVDAPAVGFVLCRGGCGAHVKASRGVCKPCAKVEGESSPKDVRSPSPAGASGRRQETCARGGRCASGAYVYYPDGYHVPGTAVYGREVEGAFLVDSLSQMVSESGGWDYYMSRMLLDVWQRTGRVFMAVCAGGSALANPCGGGLLYSELLKEVPGRVRWLIPVVCGNDFYKRRRIVEFDPAWQVALEELCTLAKEKAQYTQFILGASAKTWKYTTWMSQEQCALYDSHVQKLCSVVESCGCVAITGAAELGMLGGLVIGDSIGHVSVRSEGLLFDSFCAWVINVVLWVEGLGAVDEGVEWPEQKEEVDDEAEQVVVKRELCEEVAQIPSVEGRAYGFVPMGRGEFSDYEGLLRSNSVLVDSPEEFEEALADEFFWVGLSWHAIAICVRVQIQLWLDDGWQVPARLRRGIPERAMRKHEEGCARCESSDSLVEVLLSGRYASQLKSVSRATCSVCGFVGETCRKNWLKGEARKQDRRVFCTVCLQAEYNLEHAYRVVSDCVLGKGAFGVVRRGFHVGCFENCAVKAVGLTDAAREELELQEALQHPNVCRVFDSIESRSMMHIALELCDAGDLRVVMKETPTGLLAMDDVRGFLGDLLDAVSYMHSWGLVHRDIKPANLLLKEELWKARPVLKLADFGLAARCVQDGCLKGWGTVPYMSPEQLLGYCNGVL